MSGDHLDVEALLTSWTRALRARNRAPKTVQSYTDSVRKLVEYAQAHDLDPLVRRTVESYLADLADRTKPATVAFRYRSLQQWFKWLAEEDEIAADPMTTMKPPAVPEQPVDVLSTDQLQKLLKTCDGRAFTERRDTAIIRLFIDTGMRLAELAGLTIDDLDLDVEKRRARHRQGQAPPSVPNRRQDGSGAGQVPQGPGTPSQGRRAGPPAWRSGQRAPVVQRNRTDCQASGPGCWCWSRPPPPVPPYLCLAVARRRRHRRRSHAPCRLAFAADAPTLRGVRGGRARSRSPPPSITRRSLVTALSAHGDDHAIRLWRECQDDDPLMVLRCGIEGGRCGRQVGRVFAHAEGIVVERVRGSKRFRFPILNARYSVEAHPGRPGERPGESMEYGEPSNDGVFVDLLDQNERWAIAPWPVCLQHGERCLPRQRLRQALRERRGTCFLSRT